MTKKILVFVIKAINEDDVIKRVVDPIQVKH